MSTVFTKFSDKKSSDLSAVGVPQASHREAPAETPPPAPKESE